MNREERRKQQRQHESATPITPIQEILVQGQQRWFGDPIIASTVVIAIATVVNLGVSFGLWWSTRDSVDVARHVFEAANRPYVGLEQFATPNDRDKKTLNITAAIKNFGTAPAEKTEVKWEISLNGTVQKAKGTPANPATLMPGATIYLIPHGTFCAEGIRATYEW